MRDDPTAGEWMTRAEDDQAAGLRLHEFGHLALAAFHAQQAAEKALKAVMIANGLRIDKTHDLNRLARTVKAPAAIDDAAAFVTPFYMAGRYPDSAEGVSAADAQSALAQSEVILQWCRMQTS